MKRAIQFFLLLMVIMYSYPALALERRINSWLVCGTFPSASAEQFDRDWIDETKFDPDLGKVSEQRTWQLMDDRLYCRNLDDYVDLYTWFVRPHAGFERQLIDRRVAYAATYIWSPATRDVEIRIGANDGYKVILNREVIHSKFSLMNWTPRDRDVIPARLIAGWNLLILKVQNGQGIWGFHCNVCERSGAPLSGVEFSPVVPREKFEIVTDQMPVGYTGTPYVWMEIKATALKPFAPWVARDLRAPTIPNSSPFRLTAIGGKPPYSWTVAPGSHMPPGLYVNGEEGEILGVCAETGRFSFTVIAKDAEGQTERRKLVIEVKDNPTRWVEEERLTGLIHGQAEEPIHGDPKLQGELMGRAGYAVGFQTTRWNIDPKIWARLADSASPPESGADMSFLLTTHQDVKQYKEAFNANGVRWGSYVNPLDNHEIAFAPQPEGERQAAGYGGVVQGEPRKETRQWSLFQEALHNFCRQISEKYQPALMYFDGSGAVFHMQYYMDTDAIYSVIKTFTPECLVMGNTHDDFNGGDLDYTSYEGNNDTEAYWSRWPEPRSGLNPKHMPVETWRCPFAWQEWADRTDSGRDRIKFRKPGEPDYDDPQEWLRVLVSLIGEGFVCDLDHSLKYGREEMHRQISDWLEPRRTSLIGTRTGPLDDAAWGYNLQRDKTIYLHLIRNPRGKTGLNGATELKVAPLPGKVASARLFPDGKRLTFTERDGTLTINVSGIKPDPVSTIVAVELK